MTEAVVERVKESKTTKRADEPKRYNVIFVNDNSTSMDFVILLLESKFGYDHTKSFQVMMQIHEEGQAIVATYHLELAEQKALECTYVARQNGFPLEVKVRQA
jgi:ATP-dependent Clp protease adaptor protein ClpS